MSLFLPKRIVTDALKRLFEMVRIGHIERYLIATI